MPHTHPTSIPSNFQLIFDNALKAYKRRTKKDLLTHPLADRLEPCDSPNSIVTVLQEQVQESNGSQHRNEKWLDPTVNVLHAFSRTLGESVGSGFSPAKVIFIGFGVLFSTAKAIHADQDALSEIFERIETFFRRLDIYTEVAPNQGMVDKIMVIMVEILNFIGIATKEIKQGRIKKYFKKVIGKNDIEDSLKILDRLTEEVARMAAAQLPKVMNTIDDRVTGIADNVLQVVDNRVARIDDTVAGVGERVAGVDDRVRGVDGKVEAVEGKLVAVIYDGKEARGATQQTADADQVKRLWSESPNCIHVGHAGSTILTNNQLRQELRIWLSSPDPSTTHNIAINAHHKGTTTWFLEGKMYKEWKSTSSESLLWIHGKSGSGKSILCSTIIEDLKTICNASQASMAYHYFDFRYTNKQHWRDLVRSLLAQLATQSSPCCDILSHLYSSHGNGAQQPNDDALKRCLIEMLKVQDHHPTYLIIDALDECPDTSEVPSPRNRILQLLGELADLRIPTLRICVTSRPEFDIRDYLEPLTSRQVSLHDQSGHKQDIADYIRSVVYSRSEPHMRRWKMEDKEFVFKTLSERADGIFLWICCQLEVLRQCLPPSVRPTLRELPESLDKTYERILTDIKKPNKRLTQRVLQCLVVAVRPLRVEELAEVLAVDFDDAEGIPRLKTDCRWEEQELALRSACSGLIEIVQAGNSWIVQFSHFSVKEFLTSHPSCLATEVSNYHIDLERAHTTMAQACLGVLLQIRYDAEGCSPENHPLVRYAAKYWTTHTQFGEVSSRLHPGMKYLFDANKPHFKAWLTLYDIDTRPNYGATFCSFGPYPKSPAAPLYYAALCGFHDLVSHLITTHPADVNADGGYYVRPLVAALAGEHFQTADLLRRNGADPDVRGRSGTNPLHGAADSGNFEMVRILIEYDPAFVNGRDGTGWTPFHWASQGGNFKEGSVLRLLLEHGADINAQNRNGWTPLHVASSIGALEVVSLLLKHGADVEVKGRNGQTALQVAAGRRHGKVVKLLREHGAK